MTLNLPVVSYGCETWSFTLSEEHRVMVFKNRMLRKTFGGESIGSNRRLDKIA